MSGRKCGNCRHYETSPIWRSGWCRNPRLYSPQESHLVNQDGLECAHRVGNYWEPIELDEALPDAAGTEGRRGRVHPLRLFGPQPRLVAATASGGGAGGTGTGPIRPPRAGSDRGAGGYDAPERYVSRPADSGRGRDPRGAAGAPGADAGPERPVQPGGTPGQERPVSYQPEERYWTDYLRIALPVVGLLLMLGLFWFWAASLIGDDDDDDPANLAALATETPAPTAVTATQTPPPGAVEGANPAVAGTETPSADGTDEQPGVEDPTGADPNAETADGTEDQTGGTTEDEAEPEADSSGFSEGALVAITSDGARLRSTAESVADNIIETYDTGVEFVVTGPSEEDGDGNIWIPVELGEDPDVTGFISDTLLALSE